jgi:hypothetical protein
MNYLAIIFAAVINMGIGALWYSPVLFAKPWMKAVGFDQKDMDDSMKKGMQKKYGMMMVASLVLAIVLSWFIHALHVTDLVGGIKIGLMAWLGFTTTSQFANWVFSRKPKEAYIIDTGYQLVAYSIMGALLALWQ